MKAIIISCMLSVVSADLRQAARPKQGMKLRQDKGGAGAEDFVDQSAQNADGTQKQTNGGQNYVYYVEPSSFNYQGLKNQRNNNYDNFLRSNIDNEQDNRNFNNEAGKDHEPFRTCESQIPLTYPYQANGPGCDASSQSNQNTQPILRVDPGEARMTPLRWNNPHASEIEVNLWIMCSSPPTIVPIKKPTCSGEGNQNNIIEWAIPSDFNNVNWGACPSTACFTGCNQPQDCMLQVYAHSVETRQYASATPIVISQNANQGRSLPTYSPTPLDWKDVGNFAYPPGYDLESVAKGEKAGNPALQGQNRNTAAIPDTGALSANLQICASGERNGVNNLGQDVAQVILEGTDTAYKQLNAPNTNLYVCKRTKPQQDAEQGVDQVIFEVYSSPNGQAPWTKVAERVENYAPYEISSANDFEGSAVKKIVAKITPYTGAAITKTVYLDLRANGPRWRFRRHLQAVCPGGVQQAAKDPWLDLNKLKREVCMSAQDPNSNYPKTTLQYAVLHSDVANHAYQNSDYSPYMGQQHGEISRTMQAAAVVHMTSGNRGELGKNAIPNNVKNLVKQLNKKVNNIYQNYEKVANKIIDDLTKNGGKNGLNRQMGPQPLGLSFRSMEKGATSTKRLKTTTYVPSFEVANYDMATITKAIAQKTQGNKAKYADILTEVNPATEKQHILIYTKTLFQMVKDFDAAAKYGVTYQASTQQVPCDILQETNPTLYAMSKAAGNGNNPEAIQCCTGSMLDQGPGQCGATMASRTDFKKRNAANKKDGGLYAARAFTYEHYAQMYNCPEVCINRQTDENGNLAEPLVKTSKGTCLTQINQNNECETENLALQPGATDCKSCECCYNNAPPEACTAAFPPAGPSTGVIAADRFQDMIKRFTHQPKTFETMGAVALTDDSPLITDDTAICHTESTFTCPDKTDANFEVQANAGLCTETQSTQIDEMCRDTPCDKDAESTKCLDSLSRCEYDPESGVMCTPNSENDPCIDCVCDSCDCYDRAYYPTRLVCGASLTAGLAFLSMIVFAAVL